MNAPLADPSLSRLEAAVRRTLLLLGLLFFGVLVHYLVSGCYFIKPGESAFVLRFGRLVPTIYGPGLLIAFPSPVDEVVRAHTGGPRELALEAWRARAVDRDTINDTQYGPLRHELHPARDGYTLTGDANILQGAFTLRYQIVDPVRHHRAAAEVEATLARLFHRAATRVLAGLAVDSVIPSGLDAFRDQTLAQLGPAVAALEIGVIVTSLEIRELLPPHPVLPAFQDVNSAKVEARTYVEEARAHLVRTAQAARGEAHTLRARAEADAQAAVVRARGLADAFGSVRVAAGESPLDFRARLLAETREEVLPKLRHITLYPGDSEPVLWLRPDAGGAR